jgi:hypothetical protein
MCPATFASVPRGTPCTPNNGYCDYPEGRCACAILFAGPPQPSNQPQWACQDPAQGCPTPRPRLGTPCVSSPSTCDYGTCTVPGGYAEGCTNGIWATVPWGCALGAPP